MLLRTVILRSVVLALLVRVYSMLRQMPRVLSMGLLFSAVACSGGGGGDSGGEKSSELTAALSAYEATIAYQKKEKISHPLLLVQGFLGGESVTEVLREEIACRDDAPDAIVKISITSGAGYLPVGDAVGRVDGVIAELSAHGIKNFTLVGHNMGGLIARVAAANSSDGDTTPKVKLLTYFSPFGGVPASAASSLYPPEFITDSPFITTPVELGLNVNHYQFEITPTTQLSEQINGAEDPVFVGAQDFPLSAGEAAMADLTDRSELLSWPLSVVNLVRKSFDAAGLGENNCVSTDVSPLTAEEAKAALSEASNTLARRVAKGEGTRSFTDAEIAEYALEAPALEDNLIDLSKPCIVLVHGVDADPTNMSEVENSLKDEYNVFRFVYDESAAATTGPSEVFDQTDDFEDIADGVSRAVKKVQSMQQHNTVFIFAHSAGGVISRRAMTAGREETLAGEPFSVMLITAAAPFGGFGFANANPLFWVSSLTPAPGLYFGRMASGGGFITDPGTLGSNGLHFNIKTIETGQTFQGKIDDAASPDQQSNPVVDSDPANISLTFPEGKFELTAGHLQVIKDPNFVVIMKAAVDFMRRKSPFDSTVIVPTEPPPALNSGDTSSDNDEGESSDTTPDFGCRSGTYDPSGRAGCGIDGFAFSVGQDNVKASPFGVNGSVTFVIERRDAARADELVIFGAPDHECTFSCVNQETGTVSLTCTNPRGGRCEQGFANNQ